MNGSEQPRVIARQLAVAFGVISVVAIAMCAALIVQLTQVGGLVSNMRHGEHAIRQGAQLVTAVREQYIHLAHDLIAQDHSHTDHLKTWGTRIEEHLSALEEHVPPAEAWRLIEVRRCSGTISQLFQDQVVPALAIRDTVALRSAHQKIAVLAQEAATHADRIAEAVEGQMVGDHISATDVTRTGVITGLLFVALILILAIVYTIRLRRAVLTPLKRLTAAARELAAGALQTRIGELGRGELQQVASAFDQMATELVAREKRLVQAERMAAIGQLAAGVAHEMNNPIGIIRGYLKTMQPDGDPEVLREELKILDEEAAACQRIAEDLLAYASAPALRISRIDMGEFLSEAARRLVEGGEFTRNQVQVQVQPGVLSADRGRLRQVVANLVLNAVQLTPADQPVELIGAPINGGYEICISDRGPGIPLDERGRIFEPFYSRRAGGSGLGLSVCLGLVEAHGGHIDIQDRPQGGLTFRVFLPDEPISTARHA